MAAAAAAEAVLSSIKPPSSLAHAASALSEEQLSILHFLYDKNLERAMRILDLGGVQRVVAEPSKRTFFRVLGESKGCTQYVCFVKHFCSCHSFFYDVVARGEQLHCKHQLAARLASALELCQEVTVSDQHFASMLFQL